MIKTPEYCNRWGDSAPMEYLFNRLIENPDSQKSFAKISRLYHRYNFYFNDIVASNLSPQVKHDVLVDLVAKYKKIIFQDTIFPDAKTRQTLFYHVVTRFRKWKQSNREPEEVYVLCEGEKP